MLAGAGRPARMPVTGLQVSRVGPPQWRTYRDLRLAALLDSPRAFSTPHAQAAERTEEQWRDRLQWPTWIAYATPSPAVDRAPAPTGVVALWCPPGGPEGDISLIQLWVASWGRGAGVADALVAAALQGAHDDGWSRVVLEVSGDNEHAAECYRRAGFVPTGRVSGPSSDDQCVDREMARSVIDASSM